MQTTTKPALTSLSIGETRLSMYCRFIAVWTSKSFLDLLLIKFNSPVTTGGNAGEFSKLQVIGGCLLELQRNCYIIIKPDEKEQNAGHVYTVGPPGIWGCHDGFSAGRSLGTGQQRRPPV